jgi:uncharacterized protein (DUF433 family)
MLEGKALRVGKPVGQQCAVAARRHVVYARTMNLLERITFNARQCGGRPCVRGMRIRVTDVLDLLEAGRTPAQIIEELPDLEPDDLRACVAYASRRVDHPVLTGS